MYSSSRKDARMALSFLVQRQGPVADDPAKRVLAFTRMPGCQAERIIVKNEQESPSAALADKLAPAIVLNSPAKSSGSSGGDKGAGVRAPRAVHEECARRRAWGEHRSRFARPPQGHW